MKNHYSVIVVGSGYGASIAASRMARAGKDVCILERGKEMQPGEYPNTYLEAVGELQSDFKDRHVGSRTGMFHYHVNGEITVLVGCGLGGTSLINANVAARAEPRVFEDPRWPQALRDDLAEGLEAGYRHAEEMLRPSPYPDDFPRLKKLDALEKSANFLNAPFIKPPINVTFKDGVNHVGVEQQACKLCGDCVTGCNYRAKNTLLMNYLPDAHNHGAEIYTQVSVRHVERDGDRWTVHFQPLKSGRESFDSPTLFVSADIVVLGAGSLGSTELLLRSKAKGLSVSDRIGHGFTGNGDVLGFGYNTETEINGVGMGAKDPAENEPVGPCITGLIDMRPGATRFDQGMVIEEGVFPGALSGVFPAALAGAAASVGRDTDTGDQVQEKKRELESLVRGPHHGATYNTQTYLVMTHDDAGGQMHLDEKDRLRIEWMGVGSLPIFKEVDEVLERATKPLGGTMIPNPAWVRDEKHPLATVHPLGGCIMGESFSAGVVNHKGQVFSGDGDAIHDGLYVSDGAILPMPVGVNPLLTISAVAERNAALMAADRGWTIDYSFPVVEVAATEVRKPGIEFTERMHGYFSREVLDDFKEGYKRGKESDSPFEFILTVVSDDVDAMMSQEEHAALLVGTVTAPALSPEPMTVSNGHFNLFLTDPSDPETKRMKYRMDLRAEDGSTYYFDGFKLIHDESALDIWADTTTLYIKVHEGSGPDGPVIGSGILRIDPTDFMKQMTTMRVTNPASPLDYMTGNAKFGKVFARALFDVYGGVSSRTSELQPEETIRKKRLLRAPAPEVHFVAAGDGTRLRLTRYPGDKGPVLLSHGIGSSSNLFSIDTVDSNLVEYLTAHGYDTWLMDWRGSIELPSAASRFTADDVATHDYPAVVAAVLQKTGAPSLQAVAHCMGSMTLFMSMLDGLTGVRSIVASQVAMHIAAPQRGWLKAGLHRPGLWDALGAESLTADAGAQESGWVDRLWDKVTKLDDVEEEELCDNATCRRASFLYGQLFEHDKINETTHSAINELYGITNVALLEHLTAMTRAGHVVRSDGTDEYLSDLSALAIPITFIHGGENQYYLPRSTELTFDLLRQHNNSDLYAREVIAGYGHSDCIFGKDAAIDVYPRILEHLEKGD
jgi:cholesterol oxidase